jgi:hypothetical protein
MKGKQRPETQRGGQAKGALAAEILAGLGKKEVWEESPALRRPNRPIDRP